MRISGKKRNFQGYQASLPKEWLFDKQLKDVLIPDIPVSESRLLFNAYMTGRSATGKKGATSFNFEHYVIEC